MAQAGDHVQPAYTALAPVRGQPPVGPSVAVLDTEHAKCTEMAKLRQTEANEVAQVVLTALSQGWSVGAGAGEGDQEVWRPGAAR